jgi:hypothetical protein
MRRTGEVLALLAIALPFTAAPALGADFGVVPSFWPGPPVDAYGNLDAPVGGAGGGGTFGGTLVVGSGDTLLLDVAGNDGDGDEVGGGILAFTHAGARDSAYGSAGKALVEPHANAFALGSAAGEDGDVVLDYSVGNTLTVVRLLASGALDPSFGSGGRVALPLAAETPETATGAPSLPPPVVSSDGTIVIADGSILKRISAAGVVDGDFATLPSGARAAGLALASDGDTLVLTRAAGVGSELLAFDPHGRPDATFGSDGVASVPGGSATVALGLDVLGDANLLVTGYRGRDLFASQLLSDGARDPAFGEASGLIALTDPLRKDGSGEWNMAVGLPDGKLLLAGSAEPRGVGQDAAGEINEPAGLPNTAPNYGVINAAIATELSPSGALVKRFGRDGSAQVDLDQHAQDTTNANALLALRGGEVVLAGTTTQAAPGASCLGVDCQPGYAWLSELHTR